MHVANVLHTADINTCLEHLGYHPRNNEYQLLERVDMMTLLKWAAIFRAVVVMLDPKTKKQVS